MVFSKPFLGNVIRLNLKNHSDTVFLFKKKKLEAWSLILFISRMDCSYFRLGKNLIYAKGNANTNYSRNHINRLLLMIGISICFLF